MGGLPDNSATDVGDRIGVRTQPGAAQTIYVDNLYHVATIDGVAKLRFVENLAQVDHAGNSVWGGHDVLTVAMPVPALRRMISYLQDVCGEWDKEDGKAR